NARALPRRLPPRGALDRPRAARSRLARGVARPGEDRVRPHDTAPRAAEPRRGRRRDRIGRRCVRARVRLPRDFRAATAPVSLEGARAPRAPRAGRRERGRRHTGGRVRAVILAAGRGHRLRDVIGERPKCLARVGDRTLIERQIRSVRACGIDAIAVVAGYHALDVRRTCGPCVDLITNTRHASTNSLYSLWLARDLLLDGFVVLNCDVLFHDQLLRDLLTARDEDALLMAANRGERYSDEEMKIRARCGCVADIAKTIEPADADGENVGIAKFGEAGAAALVAAMHDVLAAGGAREWLP